MRADCMPALKNKGLKVERVGRGSKGGRVEGNTGDTHCCVQRHEWDQQLTHSCQVDVHVLS